MSIGLLDMWKIERYFFAALIFLLLSGCAGSPSEIKQQEAIDIAVEIASLSVPEISGSQVAPSNIQAEVMTLEEAAKRLNSDLENLGPKEAHEMQVWLVSMDGLWLPADAPGVVQKPYRHLSIVMDAKTGLEVFRNMHP